jgi:lysine/arginine/ornithine transport system substrate-binding protein
MKTLNRAALACVSSAVLAKPLSELRFGVEASYPPFESKSPSGQLQGFDIDLGNAICAKLNTRCVWVENAFDGLIPALQARKFDAIDSSMNVTEERLRAINFSNIIYTVPLQLVARNKSGLLPTVESLKGKRVGVLQGSIFETYAKANWASHGVDVRPYADQDQVYADLAVDRLDASLQESQSALDGFLKRSQGAGFGFAGGPVHDDKIFGQGIGIGLRKSDVDLKSRIDQAIAELKADGIFDKIAKKYFQVDVIAK